jgi:MFS family permease
MRTEKKQAWIDFFTVPRCRRALVYANMMIFLGQFTGVNAIMYYMATLMQQIGFDSEQSVFMSLVGGGSLLLGTIPACFWMDVRGRRFWANVTLPGFFLVLLFVGISYPPIFEKGNLGLYLAGIILYMGFFGSYACLTWVVPSEVYPTYLRSYGMTTSSATLFLWSFVVTYNFERMQTAMTKTGLALGFYGGIAVVGWIYQLLFMPETKGKTLEEIDLVFNKPTSQIVSENAKQLRELASDIVHFRFNKL